jgi:thioredoxin-related protein
MNSRSKRIELAANIAIIIVAILLSLVVIKKYLIATPIDAFDSVASVSQLTSFTKISIPGVNWQQNKQTLVLALSNTCHFCTESGPFYQRITKSRGGTRLVAVVPQTESEGKRYLETLGVSVDDIKQTSLDSIRVRGTPTLLLVNSEGVVINTWIGKLPAQGEEDVLSKLLSDQASN